MAKKISALATAFVTKDQKEDFKQSFEITKPAHMTPFRGMFGESKLSREEEEGIKQILMVNMQPTGSDEAEMLQDYQKLTQITSEIRAISNQSILLHGERIKKAQQVFKNYKEGAFTEWLISTYGNRQTPYSMLQYFEFYHALPLEKRPLIERIPKKAAYILASRHGDIALKMDVIENYKGEKQNEVIALIQEKLPIPETDKRAKPINESIINDLERALSKIAKRKKYLIKQDKARLQRLLETLSSILTN